MERIESSTIMFLCLIAVSKHGVFLILLSLNEAQVFPNQMSSHDLPCSTGGMRVLSAGLPWRSGDVAAVPGR